MQTSYRENVTNPQVDETNTDSAEGGEVGPQLFTWISESGRVIEQVRLVPRGDKVRAKGTIVAARADEHPAFTLNYEAELDGRLNLRRVRFETSTEASINVLELIRDSEGSWLQDDRNGTRTRVGGDDVDDVDLTLSVFFASMMIRRMGLHAQPDQVSAPVLSVSSLNLSVREDDVTFSSNDEYVYGITKTASTTATVDSEGMIINVAGLTRRA